VLRVVARQLRDGVRRQDFVCRYGGEEFALILPGMDGTLAVEMAESLRKTIESKNLRDGPITISVGVAVAREQRFANVTEFFRAADAALYKAKAQGRNRVVQFEGFLD
jgi:diguanylate cyclase (GGDEF)-like protein